MKMSAEIRTDVGRIFVYKFRKVQLGDEFYSVEEGHSLNSKQDSTALGSLTLTTEAVVTSQ